MTKTILIILLFAFLNISAFAQMQTNQVDSVTVYHSGALVNRSIKIKLKEGINQLELPGISSKIVLNSLKIKQKEIVLLNKFMKLRLSESELFTLHDQQKALENQLLLIDEKYKDSAFVNDVEALETFVSFYNREVIKIKSEIRKIKKIILENDELDRFNLQENAGILQIQLSSNSDQTLILNLSYVVGSIGWSPYYEFDVTSILDQQITVKYFAKIMSQTGEDWYDIRVSLSSNFPLQGPNKLPYPNNPWIIESSHIYDNLEKAEKPFTKTDEGEKIAKLEGIVYQEINLPSSLHTKTLNLRSDIRSNNTVFTLPISNHSFPAQFHHYAFPGISSEVFLVAEITDWSHLGFIDGMGNITLQQEEIGKTIINFSLNQDTLQLPIGKDNSVYLQRKELVEQKSEDDHNGKKQKSTLSYQYIIKNNNTYKIDIELLEQVPISQSKNSSITYNEVSGAKIDNQDGIAKWKLELSAGENTNKKLSYTIITNGRYAVSSPKYNQIQKSKNARFL